MNEVTPQILPLRDSQPVDTSGTVGNTIVDAVAVIESAARRCGIQPTALTPENLDTGRTNLFFILARLATRGLNLWAVEQFYMPVEANRVRYALPSSTEGIVGIVYRTVQRLAATSTLTGTQVCSLMFDALTKVTIIGFKLPTNLSSRLIIETTTDGTNWVAEQDFEDVELSAGWHWYSLDAAVTCTGIRLRDTNDRNLTVLDMISANVINDLPITQYNRDEYTLLNNKFSPGRPSAYYFEKKIESAINFWPVPDDDTTHFMVWRYRAVQDVGTLSNKIEVPDRWLDGITWMLSKNLAFELPNVDPVRLQFCVAESEKAENSAELGESDGAPMYIQPNIRGYTA